MKKRAPLSWAMLSMLFFSISCKKRTESSSLQQQSQWLTYTGSNEQVKSLINELKQPAFSGALVSDCISCMPDWDKLMVTGKVGDSLSYTLVPVMNKQDIAEEYIKIAREKNNHVKQVATHSYYRDYINNTDLYKKALTGINFKWLYAKGVTVPAGFSPELAEKQYLKKSGTNLVKQGANYIPKAKVALQQFWCSTDLEIFYSYFPCTDPEIVTQQFLYYLNLQLAAATGDPMSYSISVGSYVTVNASPEINVEFLATQAWQDVMSGNSCIISALEMNVIPHCSLPPESDTANPCIQKNQIIALMQNATIAAQNNAIAMHLSSGIEYATEYNLIDWATPGAGYMNTPVRTNNNSDEIIGEFSWNSIYGYSIGFTHNHPNGTGPSPNDIFEIIQHLQGPSLSAATEAEREYYRKNSTVTILTTDNTYVVTVRDWVDFAGIFSQFSDNPQAFDDQLVADNIAYGSYEVALLKRFGRSINLYSASAGTTNFVPLTVSDTNHPAEYPCN